MKPNPLRSDRRFSQNFLLDRNIIRKLLDLAKIEEGDRVLEIGPGTGTITTLLRERGADVLPLEIDRRLVKEYGWVEGDILSYDLEAMRGWKVVSNLPFAITAPILARLLPRRECFKSMTLIVQKELAERMVGKPMSRFTLLCQFYADVHYGFKVSKGCFSPKPKVDAAAVHLALREPPKIDAQRFFELVERAFQGRRKMIGTTLGKELVIQAGLDPTLRPEELTLEAFAKMTG